MTHDQAMDFARLRFALVAARVLLRDIRDRKPLTESALTRAIEIADEALTDGAQA